MPDPSNRALSSDQGVCTCLTTVRDLPPCPAHGVFPTASARIAFEQGDSLDVLRHCERERIAIAIYEARIHAAIINGWDAEPKALRERFLKAADAALQASGAVEALVAVALMDPHDGHVQRDTATQALEALGIDPSTYTGGQSAPAGCPACSPDPKIARPPHTCSGEQG